MPNQIVPTGYEQLLRDLKSRIRSAQLKAALAVNQELVLLYWQIGREILQRQGQEGWGTKVIDRLAKDLKQEFPEMKGFSPRNLQRFSLKAKPIHFLKALLRNAFKKCIVVRLIGNCCKIYASICRGLDRRTNSAASCCTNSLVS